MSGEATRDSWARRLLVTCGLLLVWGGASHIRLAGVEAAEADALGMNASIVALGLTPFVTATVLVELTAWLVPNWRPLRLSGPNGRSKLTRASLYLTPPLAAAQALLLMRWFNLVTEGNMPLGSAILTLIAGTFGSIAVAAAMSQYGLVNGYGALIAAQALPQLVDALGLNNTPGPLLRGGMLGLFDGPDGGHGLQRYGLPLLACGLAAVGTWRLLRANAQRHGGAAQLPGPTAGLVPLQSLMLPAAVAVLPKLPLPALPLDEPWVRLLLVTATALVCTQLFYPPQELARLGRGRPAAPAASRTAAHVEAVLYSWFLLGCSHLTPGSGTLTALVLSSAFAAAVLHDGWGEVAARKRLGALQAVWPLQRPYAVEVARSALMDAGIEAYVRSRGQRTLMQWFGPFLPMDVMVPPSAAKRAGKVLRATFGAAEAVAASHEETKGDDIGGASGARQPEPAPWRRLTVLALPLLLVGLLLAGRSWLATSERTQADDVPPATLELFVVADEVELHDFEQPIPPGCEWQMENAPLGGGRTDARRFLVVTPSVGETPAAAWQRVAPLLEAQLPPGVALRSGDQMSLDEERGVVVVTSLRSYLVHTPAQLTGADVADAAAQLDEMTGSTDVMIELTSEGTTRFADLTQRAVKRRIAIVVDGKVLSAPLVQEPISGGKVRISMGGLSGGEQQAAAEARVLAGRLRAARKR